MFYPQKLFPKNAGKNGSHTHTHTYIQYTNPIRLKEWTYLHPNQIRKKEQQKKDWCIEAESDRRAAVQAGPHCLHHTSSPFMNVLDRDTREGGMKKAGVKRDKEKSREKKKDSIEPEENNEKDTSAAQPSNTKSINKSFFPLRSVQRFCHVVATSQQELFIWL